MTIRSSSPQAEQHPVRRRSLVLAAVVGAAAAWAGHAAFDAWRPASNATPAPATDPGGPASNPSRVPPVAAPAITGGTVPIEPSPASPAGPPSPVTPPVLRGGSELGMVPPAPAAGGAPRPERMEAEPGAATPGAPGAPSGERTSLPAPPAGDPGPGVDRTDLPPMARPVGIERR